MTLPAEDRPSLSSSPSPISGPFGPSSRVALPFAAGVFSSAYLLFQVQPMIARYILPWFGGSPGVWTVCMMFFQLFLLAGYLYAHLLAKWLAPARQAQVHLCLLGISLFTLPIAPSQAWRPEAFDHPTLAIATLLVLSVGLPYLVVSASGPLLQHWFSLRLPGRSPYRLYALSNAGSLLGLLAYPFAVEPLFGLALQTQLWSGLYVGYGALCVLCAWPLLRSRAGRASRVQEEPQAIAPAASSSSGIGQRLNWLLWSACGSAILLAVTNQVSLDVAVVPFFWVAPLSLYLLSFILCFESERWYSRRFWVPVWIGSLIALVVLLLRDYEDEEWSLALQVASYFSAVFSCCMVCHGELARRKPEANELTRFYLFVSLGGATGGVFVNLVAPLLFNGYWELHATLLAIAFLLGRCIWRDRDALAKWQRSAFPFAWAACCLALATALGWHVANQRESSVDVTRSFYGVLNVYELEQETNLHHRALYHGRIIHGLQYQKPEWRHLPTAYYDADSGAGVAILMYPGFKTGPLRVGAVGLGVGTLATFGREGDHYRFYEINPEIERLAREHFSYLSDTASEVSVVLGDARVSLERELREGVIQNFDVLLVDAFSGDGIPVHLLTHEAFELYWKHLKPDGTLALHISNVHFDLADVVRSSAAKLGMPAIPVADDGDQFYGFGSHWVLLSRNREFLAHAAIESRIKHGWSEPLDEGVRWTDDYSNLLDVLR